MPALVWDGGSLDLPMLVLPPPLREGYLACLEIQKKVASGELVRTKQGVQEWIKSPPYTAQRSRRRLIELVTDFLDGETLEDAHGILWEKYLKFLESKRAVRIVAAAVISREGATFRATEEGDALVLSLLSVWVQGSGGG